jgi:hypothetical protein
VVFLRVRPSNPFGVIPRNFLRADCSGRGVGTGRKFGTFGWFHWFGTGRKFGTFGWFHWFGTGSGRTFGTFGWFDTVRYRLSVTVEVLRRPSDNPIITKGL